MPDLHSRIIIATYTTVVCTTEIIMCDQNICFFYFSCKKSIVCNKCSTVTSLEDLFRDKAVERELREVLFPCTYKHCTWQGKNLEYRVSCSTDIGNQ